MKVKMLTAIAGGVTASPGEVIELDDETAERFIAKGLAESAASPVAKKATAAAVKKPAKKAAAKSKK